MRKRMRFLKALIAAMLAAILTLAFTACGGVKGTITLSDDSIVLPIGNEATLSAQIKAADGSAVDKPLVWSTSDNTVVAVENGNITALAAGTATVTVKAGKLTAECVVEVFDGDTKQQVVPDGAPINISNHQNKMAIRLKKAFGSYYEYEDTLLAIVDEQGKRIPFSVKSGAATVQWTGDIGMHTWTFYTKTKAMTAEVCHATHIVASIPDFAAVSDDWDKATMGNGNELFVDWKNQNATKDWYIVLDDNVDGGMGIEFMRYYTFGRRDAKDGGYAVFNGTFDGRGYTISRLRTERGFITILGTTGVIKNVAFVGTRCGEVGGGGVLGWVGFGRVENVFIDAWMYYESQHQSGMYWYTDKQTPLTVKDCLVFMEIKENGGNWPSGDWNNPGFFSTNSVDNDSAAVNLTNSYGISTYFTRVDGSIDGDPNIVFKSYTAWQQSGAYTRFGDLWEFSYENIYFGGNLVYNMNS